MQQTIRSIAALILPVVCVCFGASFVIDGLRHLWHEVPGVYGKHDHSAQELLLTVGLGLIVGLLGLFMVFLAKKVWSSPSVQNIYLSCLCILFAVGISTPCIPGLTADSSVLSKTSSFGPCSGTHVPALSDSTARRRPCRHRGTTVSSSSALSPLCSSFRLSFCCGKFFGLFGGLSGIA